ncbi:hypothetical protein [uncultured Maribacter sp.]|uniref:hypothetical protein n=1 Tax=uncultured Maribacter sp. TaxID=431308 RepID=UPI0026061591|nr:hypothetical protein [uncultured Maribacter sp.]
MKKHHLLLSILFISLTNFTVKAQKISLTKNFKENAIRAINRDINLDSLNKNALLINSEIGNGIGVLENISFTKGEIKLELAGKNLRGKSFVGIAFNIQNDSTYEAIYFRPFNFKATEEIRKKHMVQYIHHPEYTWKKLRTEKTGKYENEIADPPNPDYWFTVKIIIQEKEVLVFINKSKIPDLVVTRLTETKSDKIGLWTGYNSSGRYKNLSIKKQK